MANSEQIRSYICDNLSVVVKDYLLADWGGWLGFYIDPSGCISHCVGADVGNEIAPSERPVYMVKCPGFDNLEIDEWAEGFAERNENGTYRVTCESSKLFGQTISERQLVADGCENGEISQYLDDILAKLGRDRL